jgi:TP901 family phage tail tape measure protein
VAEGLLPPVVAVLTANITGFKAAMGEAEAGMTAVTKSGGFGGMSTGALAATAAVVGLGAVTVHMAADFEQATNRLTTSAGETRSNLGMVSDGILNMAGGVGFTAQQLAQAMYTVDSAGFHAADSLTILKASAEGAKIEQADLGTTVDAVTTSLVDYHLGADQAATVMSKLVTAVGEGKTTLQELAGSLHSVTPLASNLHISLDEVTAAVATMTVHGMSADQATQNLADTIRHLANPTQVMTAEMGQLGLSSMQLAANLQDPNVGLHGVLEQIYTTIMQHMGPAGNVLLGTFKQSASATNDLNIMLGSMSGQLKTWSQSVASGSISTDAYKKDIKSLTPELFALGNQFLTLFEKTNGFSDALKSGSPSAQTFEAALAKMMGDSTGLNTALMLGGENMTRFVSNIDAVKGASADASGDVKNWSDVQNTLNQQLSDAEGAASSLAVKIGQSLLPAVTGFFKDLNNSAKDAKTSGMDLGSAFKDADDFFRNLTNDINNMPVPKNGLIGQFFDGSMALNDGKIHDMFNEFEDDVNKAFGSDMAAAIKKGIPQTQAASQSVAQAIISTFKANDFAVNGTTSMEDYSTGMRKAVGAALDAVASVTGSIKTAYELFDPSPEGKKVAESFGDGIKTGQQAVDAAGEEGLKSLITILGSGGGLAQNAGHLTANSFADGVLIPLPQVSANAGALVDGVLNKVSGLPSSMFLSGSAAGANLAWGLAAQEAHVAAAAAGLAATVRNHMPSSPAKVGPLSGQGSPAILGANIGRMIAEGMESSNGLVTSSMANLVNFSRGGSSGFSAPRGFAGNGSGNITVAVYIDGKEMKNAIQKKVLREERVNVNNGQSIRGAR